MRNSVQLLLEALRSGEFKQGKDYLTSKAPKQRKDRDCCLGVGCKVFNATHKTPVKVKVSFDDLEDKNLTWYGGENTLLPRRVQVWLGFRTASGDLSEYVKTSKGDFSSLIDMNDAGVPFPEIANVIESRPPGLFGKPE